jgi:hypothetical protein
MGNVNAHFEKLENVQAEATLSNIATQISRKI